MSNANNFSNDMQKVMNTIAEIAKSVGFGVYISTAWSGKSAVMEFSRYSPCGQDFNFAIDVKEGDTAEDIRNKVEQYYADFDVSEETYMWLDNFGHGKNGAPYDMKDLYEDMEVCEGYIKEFADAIESSLKL